MSDKKSNDSKSYIMYLGLAAVVFLALGLAWALVILAIWLAQVMAKRHILLDGLMVTVAGVFLFGPGLFDDKAFEAQIAHIEEFEQSPGVLDMTGRTILFVGEGDPNESHDCSAACQTIARYGAAEAVYFGVENSYKLDLGHYEYGLREGRALHSYSLDDLANLRPESAVSPVEPTKIDYIVFEAPIIDRVIQDEIFPPKHWLDGIYPTDFLFLDYAVYAATGNIVRPAENDPILTSFDYSRFTAPIPTVPGVLGKPLKFKQADRWKKNWSELGRVFCGPVNQPNYETCVSALAD